MKKFTNGLVFLPFIIILAVFCGCAWEEGEKIFRTPDFGFSVLYPEQYQAKEIRWVKELMGVSLQGQNGTITVQAMPAGTNYADMPFEEYVTIAASSEIQNFTKLLGMKPLISEYSVKGYETYWRVVEHEDTDKGPISSAKKVGPLYYFPLQKERLLGDQPVKTVMISFYAAPGKEEILKKDADEIARSFRYLNRFMGLLSKKHHGRKFVVKTGVPFRIELPANPTTGYNWYVTEIDEGLFDIVASGYDPEKKGLIGGGGASYWEIMPHKAGKSVIRLSYYRPWEGKGKAVDEFMFRVIVR